MKISLSKRIVSFVLCLTVLLAGFAYKPQKAEAFAISASVVASVIMIMTACGVTFWASTQGDAESYISGKLGEYLDQLTPTPASVLEWLGISDLGSLFVVLTGGVARFDSNVANRILDFIRWFNQEECVVSDGQPVGILGGLNVVGTYNPYSAVSGSVSAQSIGDGIIRLTFTDVIDTGGKIGQDFCIMLSGTFDGPVTAHVFANGTASTIVVGFTREGVQNISQGRYISSLPTSTDINITTGSGPLTANDYYAIGIVSPGKYSNPFSGSIDFQLTSGATDVVKEREVQVTPSSTVSVPSDLTDNDVLMVTPSVTLTEGMTVEDASAEIYDGVTSEDGLISSAEAVEPPSLDLSGILEILGSILNAILAIKQTVIGIPQAIGQAASDVITGIGNAISTALYDAFVPSEAAIDAFVVTLAANFDNHFSILSYPFSLLGKFVLEVVDAPGAHELVWPDIYEPFSGQRLIAAGSYNLDSALANENFRTAYDIYMTVIKGYIAFQFIAYLYAWFCDVFRMRNDDFANPIFEQEPIDDGPDDWDGYDSFYET